MCRERHDLIAKILDQKELHWQISNDNYSVELFYIGEDETLDIYVLKLSVDLFTKEADYVHDVYYDDGYQQDLRTTTLNITDSQESFYLSDVTDVFYKVLKDKYTKIIIEEL